MARIGIFCPPWAGHLNPHAALAEELTRRGHEMVFCNVPDAAEGIRQRGFEPLIFGDGICPEGTLGERHRAMARLDGMAAARAGLGILETLAEALFSERRATFERARLDLWLVDHLDYAASTLASQWDVPFVSTIVTLMRHTEEGAPGFSGELPSNDPEALARDRRFNEAMLEASRPFRAFLDRRRRGAGLSPFSYQTLWSSLAQITQQPAELEFPRHALPDCFHFTGPFLSRSARPPSSRNWRRDPGKPLIYASFGTAQNRIARLYESVAAVAGELDAQFVVSLGGTDEESLIRLTRENLVVSRYVPQLEILEEADLMITHAGMNSTLECLAAGTPMVAIPIAHDQPGVAARTEWTGTGLRIPAQECEPGRLRKAVESVLGNPSFRAAAQRFRKIIAKRKGLERAADIVEEVLETRRPVVREGQQPLV